MAVAIAVRQSSPRHWLRRLARPHTPCRPDATYTERPPAAYAANTDRWATLPGEYDRVGDAAPAFAVLPPLVQPGPGAIIVCGADGPAVLHLGGTWRGHVRFEASDDGRTWWPVALVPLDDDAIATETTRPGFWRLPPQSSACLLRVHVTALDRGSIAVAVAGVSHAATRRARMQTAA